MSLAIDPRLAPVAIVVGSLICFAGVGIGASIGAWSMESLDDHLAHVSEHPTSWRVANYLWIAGVPLVAAGVAAVGLGRLGGTPLAIIGLVLWLLAAAAAILAFVLQGEGSLWAAAQGTTGDVPMAFHLANRISEVTLMSFMAIAYVGTLFIGAAALADPTVSRPVAWAAVVAPILLSPLVVANIPLGALLTSLAVAAVGWPT